MTERKWSFDSDTISGTGVYTYEYEYDSDGYPTKRTAIYDNGSREVTEYTYKTL